MLHVTIIFSCFVAFSKKEFDNALAKGLPVVIGIGMLSLTWTALKTLYATFSQASSSFFSTLFSIFSTMFYISAAAFVFADSLVRFIIFFQQDPSYLTPRNNGPCEP